MLNRTSRVKEVDVPVYFYHGFWLIMIDIIFVVKQTQIHKRWSG